MDTEVPNVTWNEHPGLHDAICAAGYAIVHYSTGTWADNPEAVQVIIDSYSPLASMQKQQCFEVRAHLASVLSAGLVYDGVLIAIDVASQGYMTAMAAIASNTLSGLVGVPWPSSFAWLPQGTGPTLSLPTPQEMVTFAATVGHYVSASIVHAEFLEAQIAASTTSDDVMAVVVDSGWPAG